MQNFILKLIVHREMRELLSEFKRRREKSNEKNIEKFKLEWKDD